MLTMAVVVYRLTPQRALPALPATPPVITTPAPLPAAPAPPPVPLAVATSSAARAELAAPELGTLVAVAVGGPYEFSVDGHERDASAAASSGPARGRVRVAYPKRHREEWRNVDGTIQAVTSQPARGPWPCAVGGFVRSPRRVCPRILHGHGIRALHLAAPRPGAVPSRHGSSRACSPRARSQRRPRRARRPGLHRLQRHDRRRLPHRRRRQPPHPAGVLHLPHPGGVPEWVSGRDRPRLLPPRLPRRRPLPVLPVPESRVVPRRQASQVLQLRDVVSWGTGRGQRRPHVLALHGRLVRAPRARRLERADELLARLGHRGAARVSAMRPRGHASCPRRGPSARRAAQTRALVSRQTSTRRQTGTGPATKRSRS